MSTADHIGPYELHEILGSGGFGVVHRATHRVLQRDVALKLLFDQRDQEGFIREARILCALRHENLVGVFDCGLDGDRAFLAMELVHGETLSALLNRGALTEPQTAWVLRELLEPLAVAHKHGIVHRDIKPSNILVARDGESTRQYLVDFGIAANLDGRVTATGPLIGTARYMAPEILQGIAATESSDLWAAGVVALECVTGRVAYEGTATEIFSQIVAGPPPSLPSIPYTLLGGVIRRLLAPAETRPKSCDEVLAMIHTLPCTAPPVVAGEGSLLGLTQRADVPLATTAPPATSAHRPAATRVDFNAPTRTPAGRSQPGTSPSASAQSAAQRTGPLVAQHSAPQHSAPQHSTPQHSVPQHSAQQHPVTAAPLSTETYVHPNPVSSTVDDKTHHPAGSASTPVKAALQPLAPLITAKVPRKDTASGTSRAGLFIGLFIGLLVLLGVIGFIVVSAVRVTNAAEQAIEEAIGTAELEPLEAITAPRQFHCEGTRTSGEQERFERVLDDTWGPAWCANAFVEWRADGTIDSAAPTPFARSVFSELSRFPRVNARVRCTCNAP